MSLVVNSVRVKLIRLVHQTANKASSKMIADSWTLESFAKRLALDEASAEFFCTEFGLVVNQETKMVQTPSREQMSPDYRLRLLAGESQAAGIEDDLGVFRDPVLDEKL